MKIEAIQLGESLNIKKFLENVSLKSLAKDPTVIQWDGQTHVILFRYGVVVLWNMTETAKRSFFKEIRPFITKPLEFPAGETAEWKRGKRMDVYNGVIRSKTLNVAVKQLISVSLARTVVMDFFEQKVDSLLHQFTDIIGQFSRTGRSPLRGMELMKLAGAAMSINHQTVSQMAMLDKPDFTWDDPILDELFQELEEDYEISDRRIVLTKKIETLMSDSQFIMNVLDTRQAHLLELIIVVLFIVDIGLFFLEKLF